MIDCDIHVIIPQIEKTDMLNAIDAKPTERKGFVEGNGGLLCARTDRQSHQLSSISVSINNSRKARAYQCYALNIISL